MMPVVCKLTLVPGNVLAKAQIIFITGESLVWHVTVFIQTVKFYSINISVFNTATWVKKNSM